MELKAGYKQTEVGVMPEDWDIQRLDDLINPDRGVRYGIVQPGKFDGTGRYMIRGQDYSRGWVAPDLLFRVSHQIEERYQNARVKAGELLITIVGASTGTMAIVPDWLEGANLTQTTARLSFKRDYCSPLFFYFVLNSAFGRQQVASYIKGAAQPGLNCGDIEKFLLPVPPLPEQQAIASALSDVDELIASLDALIAKKRDLKQATMQQLLTGMSRLPGFIGDWEKILLGQLAKIKTGSRNNEDKVSDGQYAFFVRSANVEKIDSYSYDCEAILVPGEGNIGSIFHYINGKFDAHQRVYVINNFSETISGLFLFYVLRQFFGAWAMQNTVKATVDSLRLPTFQTFIVHVPKDKAEQDAIAKVISDIDSELIKLEQRREKTITLKHGMMQELLTGRTRLL